MILVKGIDGMIDISLLIMEFYKENFAKLEEIDEIMNEIEKIYTFNDSTINMINYVQSKIN